MTPTSNITRALNQLALALLLRQQTLTPAERQALADLNAAIAQLDRGDNQFATLTEVKGVKPCD